MPAFGRLPAPDPRDRQFPMKMLLPRQLSTRRSRYWNANGAWLDQQDRPHCVGYAWTHWLEDGPVTQRGLTPTVDPDTLYKEAQRADEWPGEDYDGTSIRGGVKAAQARGYIAAYHWAESVVDIVEALLEVGPVVMGTEWYAGMMDPDPAGILHATGKVLGGHAYVLNGVNTDAKIVRVKNSWGRGWGSNGHALLTFDDLKRLFPSSDGEACLAVEIRK